MEYNVKCYYSTGFNSTDIPDSPLLLERFENRTFPAVWVLQDRYRSQIKIATTYENIRDADYCLIGSTYYYIAGITMRSENMAILNLQTDFLTTIGIANLNIISGWCIRRCVTDDGLFQNVIEEPFLPTEILKIDFGKVITPISANSDLSIVTATVDLNQTARIATTYEDESQGLVVTVPAIPKVMTESTFKIGEDGENRDNRLPSTTAYDYSNNDIQENVQACRSLGIEQGVTGAYKVQGNYISESLIDSLGRIAWLRSVPQVVDSGLSPKYNSSVKNMKVFTGQFQKICLLSLVGTSQAEYSANEIYEDSNFKFIVFADLSPEGKPYCKPSIYYGNKDNLFMGTIVGATWQHLSILFTEKSGISTDFVKNMRQNINYAIDAVQRAPEVAKKAAQAAGVGGAPAALAVLASEAVDEFQAYESINLPFEIQRKIVAPEMIFVRENSLQNYIGNDFYVYRYRLSDADTIRFDNFLTQFGYAVNEPLTLECFEGRVSFNYVKAESINISPDASMIIRNGAIAQLSNGVRVWHEPPNNGAMYDNPILIQGR